MERPYIIHFKSFTTQASRPSSIGAVGYQRLRIVIAEKKGTRFACNHP